MAKPIIKWAGGKNAVLSQLIDYFPQDLIEGKIKNYHEPFLGGAAVFLWIASNYTTQHQYLSDSNEKLIQLYRAVKEDPVPLYTRCRSLEEKYNCSSSMDVKEKYYYGVRAFFNTMSFSPLETATMFLVLNKLGFNGLYRTNKKGEHNVPWGKYDRMSLVQEDNLMEVSNLLQSATLTHGDYQSILKKVGPDDFVYLDPPYRPISKTSFTKYDQEFGEQQQIELAEFCKQLPCKWMLSNSCPDDDFFEKHYADFRIEKISVKRSINSNASDRGKIQENLILNY